MTSTPSPAMNESGALRADHGSPAVPGVDELVRRELAAMTFDRSRNSNALSIPVGVLICWLLWGTVEAGVLLAWLALKVATTVWRILLTSGFDRGGPGQALTWGRRFEHALVVDGLAYGLIGPMAVLAGDTVLSVVMTATVIAIAAIGLVVLSMSFRAMVMFVLPVMLPSIPMLLLQADQVSVYLAIGSAVFLGLMIAEGRKASGHTAAMLSLRFRMDELAAQRAQALDLAERGNAVKSRFLATMSHEMRTPLHGVLGLARLLRAATLDDPQAATRLQMLERTGEHLLDLINDVLDHSRIEGGRFELAREPFDLVALLGALAELTRVSATEKGLELQLDLVGGGQPSRSADWVEGDPARLRQIMLNLLGNAVKFTARGAVTLRLQRMGSSAVIDVVDTGEGVAPADRERIFQAFEQGDSSFARRHGGTGLGLTISRELARAMGGDIVCLDAPGGGSTFRLTLDLPATAAPAPPPPATAAPATRLQGRVLLAEDNEVNAIVAGALLTRLGAEVVTAGEGLAAVRLAAEEHFDLILMDGQMPVLDGFEAASRIRAWELAGGRRRTPIVALTANAMPNDRERSLAAGMDDHLAKPFAEPALEAVLRRYLTPAG
jgi:two-component system, sensor histidine kinase